jgi:hypothetical protein
MPNLRNDYAEGVGRTVLDLFKKVFQIKKDHVEKQITKLPANTQTGGAGPDEKVEKVEAVDTDDHIKQGHVKLTNVAQYYDGTIYEGVINYDLTHDISFNIKDRTKPQQTTEGQ